MKYYIEEKSDLEDGLLGGLEFPVEMRNVSLESGAQVSRGMLLAGENGVYNKVGAGDAEKSLCIAARDFTADSLNCVTQAYFAGKFNEDAITIAEGLSVAAFEDSLRKQNIHLTSRR